MPATTGGEGGPTAQMDAGGNPKNIAWIYDIYDDASRGTVDYGQWLGDLQTLVTEPISWVTDPVDSSTMKASLYTVRGVATALAGIDWVEVSTDGGSTWDVASRNERLELRLDRSPGTEPTRSSPGSWTWTVQSRARGPGTR